MSEMASGDVPQMLALGIAASERGEYAAALTVLSAVYQRVPPEKFPDGLSSYGLCLAHIENKNKLGAEYCQKAIALQGYEGKHWANLVRLYIKAKNRRKAVDVLENGLKKLPNDAALVRIREEIGYRKTPHMRLLRRNHPLNKLYSRSVGRLNKRGRIILIVVAALLYVGMMVGVFFLIIQ
jgi:tetratricopeptide (TPR) repeat protein